MSRCDVITVTKSGLKPCGCGETGQGGNQEWWRDAHINTEELSRLMNHRFWAISLCEKCYHANAV